MTFKNILQPIILTACIGWAGYSAFFSATGILHHQQIKAEIIAEKKATDAINLKTESLKVAIAAIKENSFTLEKIAREDLHMSCTNEYVYLLKSRV